MKAAKFTLTVMATLLATNIALADSVVCPANKQLKINCKNGQNCEFDNGTKLYEGWYLNPGDLVNVPSDHDVLNFQTMVWNSQSYSGQGSYTGCEYAITALKTMVKYRNTVLNYNVPLYKGQGTWVKFPVKGLPGDTYICFGSNCSFSTTA